MILSLVGFHRSLTSAIAQWLHKAGLPMGTYLIPGHPSNPDGHYEDKLAVELHDGLLASCGSDWRFHGEVDLDEPSAGVRIKRYVAHRNALHGSSWGIKDPRQCLFLSPWAGSLGESGRYLVVIRHWSGSVQSLLKRHSDVLVESCGRGDVHSSFWREPDLAAEMWLAYNRRLLSFLKESRPGAHIVVTQQSVLAGLPLPRVLNNVFGLGLDPDTPSPLKPNLSHDQIDENIRSLLSVEKQQEMDRLWEELLALADHRSDCEEPVWSVTGGGVAQAVELEHHMLESAEEVADQLGELAHQVVDVPEGLAGRLQFARRYPLQTMDLEGLWRRVEIEGRFDSEMWELLSEVLIQRGQPEKAQSALVNVFLSGNRKPYIYMMLGRCREAVLDFPGAEHFYSLAVSINPANPRFYVAQASLMLVLGRADDAELLLKSALGRKLSSPTLYSALANVFDQQGRSQAALELLEQAAPNSSGLEQPLFVLKMKADLVSGMKEYQQWCRANKSNGCQQGLIELLARVGNVRARKDLAKRLSKGLVALNDQAAR